MWKELIHSCERLVTLISIILHQFIIPNYFDRPILYLLGFYLIWFTLLIKFRHVLLPTTVIFFFSCLVIFFIPSFNIFFGSYWNHLGFSRNYFDVDGYFISAFLFIPFSLTILFTVFLFFCDLCKMLAVHHFFEHRIPQESILNTPVTSTRSKYLEQTKRKRMKHNEQE
ncbi:hypothetical protein TRFO_27967 [Tritrichomonas foetus]|uniref:Uncharacterized protein n=1 Tax=Tritrichomonas foetus TaxID=1144522 RepID=A0A1J4K442_9EUKA|nr:hypothetical protein TRFO_27967 [Tritrichomonas foetus]|eukprot:OHT04524.1 hypothetical protein TRFO_27967 [Tritrichomonas foetus]